MLSVNLTFNKPDNTEFSTSYCVPGSAMVLCGDGARKSADQIEVGEWVYVAEMILQVTNKTVEVV